MSVGGRSQWRVALLIVLVTGLLMGFFVWKTFFEYVPDLYPLPFKQGQWITTAAEAPQGYFRKELYIPSTPLQATVTVAGTDSFALYVNGRTIDDQTQAFLQVSGIYDIGSHLHPGKNVIALATKRLTYPGPAKVALEGRWIDQSGRDHELASDSSWQASAHEGSQAYGGISWYTTEFSADAWAPSRTLGLPLAAEVAPVLVHPDLFRALPLGKWIGHAGSRPHRAIFSHTFEVTQRVQGAWVRVAAAASYELAINGITVSGADTAEPTFSIYDISPFLTRGTNTISVNVTAVKEALARLLLDGFIAVSGHTQPILATGSTWMTKEPSAVASYPAVVLTSYPTATPPLAKRSTMASLPISYTLKHVMHMLGLILGFLGLTAIFWKISSSVLHHIGAGLSPEKSASIDALLHLPSFLFLLIIFLLQYDARFNSHFPFQSKFIYFASGILFALRGIIYCSYVFPLSWFSSRHVFIDNSSYRSIIVKVCVIVITVSGLALRLYNLDAESLSHDESGLPVRANMVLERGYPVTTIGPIEKPVTTYEFLPYPIALSMALFGETDFAVRLPAVIFGTLTILLIFHISHQLWGASVGILAAMIYAFSPFALTWGSNAFHPQQTQFLALLASYLFYRSLVSPSAVIVPKYLYGSALYLILTYLSWEPSAFLLPTLFVGLLIVKGRDFRWMKSRHLWLSVLMVSMVIFLQLSYRILANAPYIVVGKGLSDSMITFFFLDSLYNPWFYLEKFLLSGPHISMLVVMVLGTSLLYRNLSVLYHYAMLLVPLFFLTNFIPNQSTRYIYFVIPHLIMISSVSCITLATFVLNQYLSFSISLITFIRVFISLIVPTVFFFSTTNFPVRLYNLGYSVDWLPQMINKSYDTDYRSTAYFIERNAESHDIIISSMPHTLEYYIQRTSNYYLQTYTNRQIFYDISEVSGNYLDKYIGSPVIRNLSELLDVLYRHHRVWIIAAPYGIFEISNEPKVLDYIKKHSKVMYESYRSRVYLWQH